MLTHSDKLYRYCSISLAFNKWINTDICILASFHLCVRSNREQPFSFQHVKKKLFL